MPDERGVSEVLGYALVFSLVLVSVAIVSTSGLSAFQNAESFQRQQNAQRAFDVMHSNIEEIYYQDAPSRATEIALGQTRLKYGEPVVINVTVDGESVEVTSRPLIQELGGGTQLVYEAGAVFYTTEGGGRVSQEPPMLFYTDSTNTNITNLIVPSISAANDRGVGGGRVLVRARSTGRTLHYANTTRDPTANLVINITSPRADLWHEYLTSQSVFRNCDDQSDDDRVVCGPVSVDQVYVVEPRVTIFFDR